MCAWCSATAQGSSESAELHRQDDPTAHIGIRLVMAEAKNAVYLNSYGLNNLTLQI